MSKYQPVPFNPAAYAETARLAEPAFRDAYDALEDEFATLAVLLEARQKAGLTQAELAQRMGVSQPVVARIEGNLGSRKQTPSLDTLRRYAEACGGKLRFQVVIE